MSANATPPAGSGQAEPATLRGQRADRGSERSAGPNRSPQAHSDLAPLCQIVSTGWVWEQIPEDDRALLARLCADLLIRTLEDIALERQQAAVVALVAPQPAQAAPTPQEMAAPLPEAPSAAAVPFGETDDHSYEEFATMLDGLGVGHVPMAMNRWFRDCGGWDKSTPEDRDGLFRAMRQHYTEHPPGQGNVAQAGTQQAPPGVNMTMCPRCGGRATLIPAGTSRATGKPYKAFYRCANTPECKTSLNGKEKTVSWGTPTEWQARWNEAAAGRVG